jgi:putative FmdB family regulatory protein
LGEEGSVTEVNSFNMYNNFIGVVMPVYDYKCKLCGDEIEILHKSLGKCYRVVCPRCDTAMKRLPSSANIKFIGNGWSKDGYSKEKK